MLVDNRAEPRAGGSEPYCNVMGSFYDAPDAVGDYQAREMDIGKFTRTRHGTVAGTSMAIMPPGTTGPGCHR